MKALVAGAAGQLGRELAQRLGGELSWAGGRDALDVTDERAVAALVARLRPDVVFNATAYNRVDAAESEPERAFAVNALAPRALALASREAGALLVHVSTDYVFDGTSARPYREDDAPHPLSVYGASKLQGERHVLESGAEALVVRTSGVLARGGSVQKGGSFVDRASWRRRARASGCAWWRTRCSRRHSRTSWPERSSSSFVSVPAACATSRTRARAPGTRWPWPRCMKLARNDPLERHLGHETTFWRTHQPNPLGARAAARHHF